MYSKQARWPSLTVGCSRKKEEVEEGKLIPGRDLISGISSLMKCGLRQEVDSS